MKQYIFTAVLASVLLTTSCSDDTVEKGIPNSQKEMISFSLSDGSIQTRAGFIGGETRIVARMQSNEKDGTGVRYTRCVLKAKQDNTGQPNDYSEVIYSTASDTRYWDEAFGRKGQISVYAVAIPNSTSEAKLQESLITGSTPGWATEAPPNNTIQWRVTADQSTNPLAAEDLVYSNNIQEGGNDGRYVWSYTDPVGYPANTGATTHADGRLVFTQATGAQESDPGHFDKGHLVFTHSLSRLTVTLQEGVGFNASSDADFKFNSGTKNICLLNMYTSGTLDIQAGTWALGTPADITAMAPGSTYANANGTYAAQMLPGYKFYENGTTNVMQYVIDDNMYYVTQGQIYTALNVAANTEGTNPLISVKTDGTGNYIEMEQQKNYQLTITVDKTGIASVTATLAKWVDVSGNTSVDNTHLTFSMTASGERCTQDIDLYRLEDVTQDFNFSYQGQNWFGNYLTDASHKTELLQSALSNGKWSTNWYFESNKTYYHFRTVNKGTTIKGNSDNTNDYFTINGGATASTDPHWGAPMTGSSSAGYLKYDVDKGYEAFLLPAIGATGSDIVIQELHMMSNIKVILQTLDDGSKVTLRDGTTPTVVKITRLATSGTVEMGRGLVTPTSSYSGEHEMTVPGTYYETEGLVTKPYTFTVVPQSLSRNFSSASNDDYVGLSIQTPDNNQYYVVKKLSEITATSVSDERDHAVNSKIQRWYPGHNYTYYITISKKGIESITCSVAKWVNVTGDNINIDLED